MKLKLHWQILIAICLGAVTGWLTGDSGAIAGILAYDVYDFGRAGRYTTKRSNKLKSNK